MWHTSTAFENEFYTCDSITWQERTTSSECSQTPVWAHSSGSWHSSMLPSFPEQVSEQIWNMIFRMRMRTIICNISSYTFFLQIDPHRPRSFSLPDLVNFVDRCFPLISKHPKKDVMNMLNSKFTIFMY